MPTIKSSTDFLAVMSMETYEMLIGKLELYRLLDEGKAAVAEGRKRPLRNVMQDIRQEVADGKL